MEESDEIPKPQTSISKKDKYSLKTKIILIACVVCSSILGLTATGLYVNLAISLEGHVGVESFLIERASLIPLMFIVGFLVPLIAFPLTYVCRVIEGI